MGVGRTEDMPALKTYLMPEDIAFAIRTVLEQPRRLRTQYWTLEHGAGQLTRVAPCSRSVTASTPRVRCWGPRPALEGPAPARGSRRRSGRPGCC